MRVRILTSAATKRMMKAQPRTLPRRAVRVPRWLGLCGAPVVGVVYLAHLGTLLLMAVHNWGLDLRAYWDGALGILAGQGPYGWVAADPAGGAERWLVYIYPPLLAILLVPLAASLDFETARWLWLGFSALSLALAVPIVVRAAGLRLRRGDGLVVGLGLTLLPWTVLALGVGQPSPQMLLLVAGAYAALAGRQPVLAGTLLALAACSRVLPAPVLGFLLLRRQWRAVASAVAVGLALVAGTVLAVGWQAYVTYFTDVSAEQTLRFALPNSVSVTSVFTRLFLENQLTAPLVHAPLLGRAAIVLGTVVVVVVTGVGIWRAPATPAAEAAAYGAAVVGALLIAPISGTYNLVIAALPLAIAVAQVQRTGGRYRGLVAAAMMLLVLPAEPCDFLPVRPWCLDYVATGVPVNQVPLRMGAWTLAMTGPFLGLLLLWLVLLRQAREAIGSPDATRDGPEGGGGGPRQAY